MKAFFQGMNFPRLIILLSFLASSGLGWNVYDKQERLKEVQQNLKKVPEEVTKMQSLGIELEQYQDQVASSGATTAQDLPSQIRDTAADRLVGIGSLTITPMTPKVYRSKSKDVIYKITPKNKTQSYSRNSIANFLYKLEYENRRIKVTSFNIKPFTGKKSSRPKPGEIFSADRWTFEAEITFRTKNDDK